VLFAESAETAVKIVSRSKRTEPGCDVPQTSTPGDRFRRISRTQPELLATPYLLGQPAGAGAIERLLAAHPGTPAYPPR
jgi:hypothetical protein